MRNVRVAFECKNNDEMPFAGWKEIQCHWVCDVKIGDLTRKVCIWLPTEIDLFVTCDTQFYQIVLPTGSFE